MRPSARQLSLLGSGFGLLVLGLAPSAAAQVRGQVTSTAGLAIENARISAPDGATCYSDGQGRFTFPSLQPPVELTVSHSRFVDVRVRIADSGVADIQLLPKQEVHQEIAVSATRGETSYAPSSSSASVIDVARLTAPAATLAEVVATAPGVAENGQGGIFQSYSVRGVARQRVLTLFSGMRIIGERRAGVSASFLDASLMGKAEVLRGPASTYYGSGALGGVIQLFARTFEQSVVEVGSESNGGGWRQLVGWGDGAWSLGLAHRASDNGETPGGTELNDRFDQTSSVIARSWRRGARDYSLQAIASGGTNIGKSNVDYPGRVTDYPEENHLLLRFAVSGDEGWGFDAWAHPNDLETLVARDGFATTTFNDAVDLGVNWYDRRQWGERTTLRYGAEYFGRRRVEAREEIRDLTGVLPTVRQTPLDGTEDEVGLYAAYERNWNGTVLLLGGRLAALRQRQEGFADREDSALAGFAGIVQPLGASFELALNVGSGLRFPSLSERFFSGVTPRGVVSGNPDLEAERSVSTDLALRHYGARLFLSGGLFSTRVESYIERLELAAEELTSVNLIAGDLMGFELDGGYLLSDEWNLTFGGHAIDGRGDGGEPLDDVPADRVFVSAARGGGAWSLSQRWEHRFAKGDPGPSEVAIDGADLVALAVTRALPRGLELTVALRNLLDETYFSTADDKAARARGRSVALTLRWSG